MKTTRVVFMTAATVILAACSKNDQATSDTAGPASTNPPASTQTASTPDREFLTKMTDHHEGMVQMAEAAMTKASKPATQGDAHNLHTKQAAERDSMVAMLRSSFNDSHTPTVMPENKAMMDSVNAKSGAAYDREFYAQTIKHHQDGIQMIDQYLPQLTDPKLKAMAEKMKADQQKEIQQFEPKTKG
jgi:uncharacterized protein (DUF305 family)